MSVFESRRLAVSVADNSCVAVTVPVDAPDSVPVYSLDLLAVGGGVIVAVAVATKVIVADCSCESESVSEELG